MTYPEHNRNRMVIYLGHIAPSRERFLERISPELEDKATKRSVETAAAAGTATTAEPLSFTPAPDGAHENPDSDSLSRNGEEMRKRADTSPLGTNATSTSSGQQEQDETTETAHKKDHSQKTPKETPALAEKSLKDSILNVIGQPLRKERQVAPLVVV